VCSVLLPLGRTNDFVSEKDVTLIGKHLVRCSHASMLTGPAEDHAPLHQTTGAQRPPAPTVRLSTLLLRPRHRRGGPRPEGDTPLPSLARPSEDSFSNEDDLTGIMQSRRSRGRSLRTGSWPAAGRPASFPPSSRRPPTIRPPHSYGVGPRQSPAPVITAGTKRRGRQCEDDDGGRTVLRTAPRIVKKTRARQASRPRTHRRDHEGVRSTRRARAVAPTA